MALSIYTIHYRRLNSIEYYIVSIKYTKSMAMYKKFHTIHFICICIDFPFDSFIRKINLI